MNGDNSIVLASGVNLGDKVHLVHGSRNRLVRQLPMMARQIMERISDAKSLLPAEKQICGAVSIYCGGCLLHVEENINAMASTPQRSWRIDLHCVYLRSERLDLGPVTNLTWAT